MFWIESEGLVQSDKISLESKNGKYLIVPTVGYHWKFIGIRPSDPSSFHDQESDRNASDGRSRSDPIGSDVGFKTWAGQKSE